MSGHVCYTHRVRGVQSTLQSTVDYDTNQRPCGASNNSNDVFSCCNPGDTCMENNICQSATPSGNGTGWYISGCTDANFDDPACPQHCFDQSLPDITFNDSSSTWSCCSSGIFSLRCDLPGGTPWQAPAPDALKKVALIPSSATVAGWQPSITPSSSSSSASLSSISTSSQDPTFTAISSTNTPINAPNSSSGLSSDAKAGVISAAVVIVLVFIVAGAFLLFRRRRRNQQQNTGGAIVQLPEKPMLPSEDYRAPSGSRNGSVAPPYAGYYKSVAEVPANIMLHEKHGRPIVEMPQGRILAEMPTSSYHHPS